MNQYFQLTPEILLEYVYENNPKLDEDGIKGNIKDIHDDTLTMMLKSNVFSSKYFCFKNESEGLNSFSNLVLPLNNTETQFVLAKNTYQNFFSKNNVSNMFGNRYIYEDTNYDKDIIEKGESCDVKFDKCIIHFTSGNYFGNYDSLIFQSYVYMKDKSKLYFASFLFKKTSNLEMTVEHMLYKEKLYTTQIEFDVPSAFAIFTEDNKVFNNVLKSQNIELLQNTPVGINVYGVTGSKKGIDNYERFNTLKINSICIPYIYKKLDEIHVNIYEADDGDFYYIDPEMSSSYTSFADYIERMGEDIRAYMVMHELCLKEVWVDSDGAMHSDITHKEYHIIDINEDDTNVEISKRFDAKIKYRPICTKSGGSYRAIIVDTIKIMNTVDSSAYEVTGSLEIANPYKYGKRLKRLELNNELRPIVNVYNKKVENDNGSGGSSSGSSSGNGLNSIINLSKGKGFSIENKTQNITSFIECTNIGVSITELSPDDIN